MGTPQEFLLKVKEALKYVPDVEGTKSEEFGKITRQEFDDFSDELKAQLASFDIEDDTIVVNLVKQILPVLTDEERLKVNKVAFGKVYSTIINAACVKSLVDHNLFCIVINEGLLMLLHKHGKLMVAAMSPDCVTFCSRGDHGKITSQQYHKWATELFDNYKTYNTAIGPMIKLNGEGKQRHWVTLQIQELFVLCHELGHYLNGDLESSQLVTLINTEWSVFDENKDHVMEYKADLTAFDILTKVLKQQFGIGRKQALIQVIVVFDILGIVDPAASDDHPAPIDRVCNIIDKFFGPDFVAPYVQTYKEPHNFADFIESLPE